MVPLAPGALLLAFVVTLLEMTEVVVLVYALGIERGNLRTPAYGALAGLAVVAVIALAAGSALSAVPSSALLGASAIVLAAFGLFLFRSTLRTYRRARDPVAAGPPRSPPAHFAGGFAVGAIEATEVVVVLVPLAAGGQAAAALLGAVTAGIVLVVAVALVHERIRRVKTPWLKLGATSLLFAFATFWGGTALGVAWPGSDLFLIPLFLIALVLVRGTLEVALRRPRPADRMV